MKTLVWLKKDNREFYHLYKKLDKHILDNIYSTLLNDSLISDYHISETNLNPHEIVNDTLRGEGKIIKVQIMKE